MGKGGLTYAQSRSNASVDAFARRRVSTPFTLFDSKQLLDAQPLQWDDAETSGAGTSSSHNPNIAASTMAVSLNTAGVRVRQTRRRFNYQPGKSQLIFMSGVLGAGVAGIRRRIGAFAQADGLFFELLGTTLSVVKRSYATGAAVDTAIPQSAWNLDKLDGTGPSGRTIDTSKAQIFVIDFEWLGVGDARFGTVLDGDIIYCHAFAYANIVTSAYMSSPNLPLRYELQNLGTGPAASLIHICSSVMAEGGFQELGFPFSLDRTTALVTRNDARIYPMLGLRFRSGRSREATIRFTSLSIVCTSTAAFRWALILNPIVAGVALSFTGVANSALEVDVSRTSTTTITGGHVLVSGVSQTNNESVVLAPSPTDFYLGSTIAGVSDILVLAIQRLVGGAETFYGTVSYRELI